MGGVVAVVVVVGRTVTEIGRCDDVVASAFLTNLRDASLLPLHRFTQCDSRPRYRTFPLSQVADNSSPNVCLPLTHSELTASLNSLGPLAWVKLSEEQVCFTIIPEQGTQVWA